MAVPFPMLRPPPGGVDLRGDYFRVITEGGEPYDAFSLPNLPNALAKVRGVKDAKRFLEAFGPLGYLAQFDYGESIPQPWAALPPGLWEPGADFEPVQWVLDQAATVRFALLLIEALQGDDEGELGRVLQLYAAEGPKQETDAEGSRYWSGWYRAAYRQRSGVVVIASGETLRDHAGAVVAHLVNAGTDGIRVELVWREWQRSGSFAHAYRTGRGLIAAIWHHVGAMAVALQDGNGRKIRLCQECGTPFLVTDERQRFCPAVDGLGSRCAARHRQRRAREAKKEGRHQHGG